MGFMEHTLKPPEKIGDLLGLISQVYDHRLKERGPSANGVFWKNAEGQILRHEILLQIIAPKDLLGGITINDLGCGYGALFEMIKSTPLMKDSRYFGNDISAQMIEAAHVRNHEPCATFKQSAQVAQSADYSFASGTFNMFMGADPKLWRDYVFATVQHLWEHTNKGLAFNLLDSSASDHLIDLYYADLDEVMDFTHSLTPHVEVVDDYPLDEWTIYLRR